MSGEWNKIITEESSHLEEITELPKLEDKTDSSSSEVNNNSAQSISTKFVLPFDEKSNLQTDHLTKTIQASESESNTIKENDTFDLDQKYQHDIQKDTVALRLPGKFKSIIISYQLISYC